VWGASLPRAGLSTPRADDVPLSQQGRPGTLVSHGVRSLAHRFKRGQTSRRSVAAAPRSGAPNACRELMGAMNTLLRHNATSATLEHARCIMPSRSGRTWFRRLPRGRPPSQTRALQRKHAQRQRSAWMGCNQEKQGRWRTCVLVGRLDVRLELGAQRRFCEILLRNRSDEVAARLGTAASVQQPPPLGGRVIALRDLSRERKRVRKAGGSKPCALREGRALARTAKTARATSGM
jgi:hypothetical protein